MNTVHSPVQVSTDGRSTTAYQPAAEESARLVVVVFDAQPEGLLASRISALAEPRNLPILLVGVATDRTEAATLRRKLVTVGAFLKEQRRENAKTPCVEFTVEQGRGWLEALQSMLRRDDLLACCAGQYVGARQRPLIDILSSKLNVPIYAITELEREPRNAESLPAKVISWLAPIASIGGFFLLQARIVAAVQGPMQGLLLLITLIGEVGLIWILNAILKAA